jgi:hypothetical protein
MIFLNTMGDFQDGVQKLTKEADAANDGYRPGDDNAEDYRAGWDAANSDDPKGEVQKNYGGDEKAKKAFKKGYASGASRRTS